MADTRERGIVLHREFVGMLFALAIAQVAVQSGEIVNSGVDAWDKAPGLSHLLLSAIVIATSWVGWGRSEYSLSPVEHVFTKDFVELMMDVWLVGVYFFLVRGAETLNEVQGVKTMETGSAAIEALWVMAMFLTYVLWDGWTKRKERLALVQRGWASILCAVLAVATFFALRSLRGTGSVVLADLSLLALVLLFRAMKVHNFSAHTRSSWKLISVLATLWIVFMIAARSA